jgi:DNA-binding NtrC family response regulator
MSWRFLFLNSPDPLFLVSQRRRIVGVNRAWEERLGIPAAEARGLVCRLRATAGPPQWKLLCSALCPPPEVWDGRPSSVRRSIVRPGQPREWWDLDFLPLRDRKGRLRVLGRIGQVRVEDRPDAVPLPATLAVLRERFDRNYQIESLTSDVSAVRRLANQVRLAARSTMPVLVCGERGSGKGWVARVIHQTGANREQHFAAFDGAALPATLADATLFGAGGLMRNPSIGTVYLRNVAELPRDIQLRLCDWLAEAWAAGPRLIAGCTGDAHEAMRAGKILEPLHCTLSTLVLEVPPLRDRRADLPALVDQLGARLPQSERAAASQLTPAALDVLLAYSWPGNLRELCDMLAQARSRARGTHIDVPDLPLQLRLAVGHEHRPKPRPLVLDAILEQVERRLMALALRKARGNKSRAADHLSIWRARFIRRMEALRPNDTEHEPPP